MLFREAVDQYLSDKSKRLRETTIDGYISALNRHVLPRFGEIEVESIGFDDVQEWIDAIPTYGAAHKAYKTFRQVYRWILRRSQIRIWDVTQGIELPEKPVVRQKTLTAKEESITLRAIWGEDWEAAILLAASLGLRRSEACGVDWSDIDWRSGWVHIQRGAHWVHGRRVEYPTKTKSSDRWLRLPRFALLRLKQIRGTKKVGRVCSLSPLSVARKFKQFCKKHKIPWATMMCLRHSWATIAIESGAHLEDVSVASGHRSTDMIRQHYIETMRTVVKRPALRYESAILNAS